MDIAMSRQQFLYTMFIQQNDSTWFFPMVYNLSDHRFLAVIVGPGVGFISWSRPEFQSERKQLLLNHLCDFITSEHFFFFARIVIILAHSVLKWKRSMITFFLLFTQKRMCTFQQNGSLPVGIKLLIPYQLDFSMFCDSNMWYLQQQVLIIKSKCYSGEQWQQSIIWRNFMEPLINNVKERYHISGTFLN